MLKYYTEMPKAIVLKQIKATLDLVFYAGAEPGNVDQRVDGNVAQTLTVLHRAKVVSDRVTLDYVKSLLVQ